MRKTRHAVGRFSLMYGALALLAGCRGCDSPAGPPAASALPSGTPPASAVASAMASAIASAAASAVPVAAVTGAPAGAPAPSAPCTAIPVSAFHLRAAATAASSGPELPARTNLDVLGVGGGQEGPLRRRTHTLLRVRVHDTGAEGFTFVGPDELSASCPLVWPETLKALASAPTRHPGADRNAAYLAAWSADPGNQEREPPEASALRSAGSLDLDGDGALDELVEFSGPGDSDSTVRAAVFARGGAFTAQIVGYSFASEHASFATNAGTEAPLRFAGAVYLRNIMSEVSSEPEPPINDYAREALLRCRPGGACNEVFSAYHLHGSSEEWTYSDAGNGSVTLRNAQGRTQTLRWDPVAWRLVP